MKMNKMQTNTLMWVVIAILIASALIAFAAIYYQRKDRVWCPKQGAWVPSAACPCKKKASA
jgi:hypothetical protein